MGADVHMRGPFKNTCLHLAAERGHTDTVKKLVLSFSADVNASNLLDKKPLHLAAYNGHKQVVTFLLESGTHLSLLGINERPPYDLSRHDRIWRSIVANALRTTDELSKEENTRSLFDDDGLPTYRCYCLAAILSRNKTDIEWSMFKQILTKKHHS